MEDLKPCPFCGADAYEVPEYHYVMCIKCAVTAVSHDKSEDYSESCKMWNTRPIEDALRAEIDALLFEWNLMVKTIGAKTHGTAIGEAGQIVRERDALRASLATLEAKVQRLEAVRVAAEGMFAPDAWSHSWSPLDVLREALQAAGEESGHDPR